MLARWPALACIFVAVGCTPVRVVTLRANPREALIHVNDTEIGRGPIAHRFVFLSETQIYRVSATLPGYKEAVETVTLNSERDEILLDLRRDTKQINILVEPAPAIVKLDGDPLSSERISAMTREVELGFDERGVPISRTLTAERVNFLPAQRVISAADRDLAYTLRLEPMRKNVTVTTDPPGAEIYLDEELVGTSPYTIRDLAFPVDLQTDEFIPRSLRVARQGFDPITRSISWDNGQTDYAIAFGIREKEVRIFVDPPGATITIDGEQVANDTMGWTVRTLPFPPINDKGDLKTYTVTVSKKSDRTEWAPRTFTLAWEEGRTDYRVGLEEVLTLTVPRLAAEMKRDGQNWAIVPRWDETIARRDPAEPVGRPQPRQLTNLANGTQIDSLAIAPDGSRLVFTVLASNGSTDFRSQMFLLKADGTGGAQDLSDGRWLDLTPCFTPSGEQVLFSSNRQGGTMQLWRMESSGVGEPLRITNDVGQHFWPTVDSDPRPRLYWQEFMPGRDDPRLRTSAMAAIEPVDLISAAGTQPRISLRNDAVIFCRVDPRTGKRDIYRVDARGGEPVNLTNTPDADECDATFSRNGSKIVFSSDRGVDEEGRHNFDIWMIDLASPDQPQQLTSNGSVDDCPSFDAFGNNVYFRSNRGGQWAIWKIQVR